MKEFDYSDENIKRTIKADYFQRNVYIKNLINYMVLCQDLVQVKMRFSSS